MIVAADDHGALLFNDRASNLGPLGFVALLLVDVNTGLPFDPRHVSLVPQQRGVGNEDWDLVGAKWVGVVKDNVLKYLNGIIMRMHSLV